MACGERCNQIVLERGSFEDREESQKPLRRDGEVASRKRVLYRDYSGLMLWLSRSVRCPVDFAQLTPMLLDVDCLKPLEENEVDELLLFMGRKVREMERRSLFILCLYYCPIVGISVIEA